MRLDLFLVSRLDGSSRSTIARAIAQGRASVDGTTRKASYKLSNGEVIHFEPLLENDREEIEPATIEISVLYEDEYLLVVDKPSGLSTHPSSTSREPTLVNALVGMNRQLSDEAGGFRPGIVHRLDKDTSGLLVVAKNNAIHRKLQAAIQRKEVERAYWAWVRGVPAQSAFTVRSHLGRHPKNRKKRAVVAESASDARLAVTHCKVIHSHNGVTKLECSLETGRTHQIRVHLAAVGLQILGDLVYGVADPRVSRQALHAARLRFTHPVYGVEVVVEAPIPADLASVD